MRFRVEAKQFYSRMVDVRANRVRTVPGTTERAAVQLAGVHEVREEKKMFTAESQEIKDFLDAWHENNRSSFERRFRNLRYDDCERKTAKERRKYIALDEGTSGRFLVDKQTGVVCGIAAYGVPKYRLGHIGDLTREFHEATEHNRSLEGRAAYAELGRKGDHQ